MSAGLASTEAVAAPGGEKRKRQRRNNISWNDIKVVQNLIERCVQHHMTQAEIVTALKVRHSLQPNHS
jgi:hypothetical protein